VCEHRKRYRCGSRHQGSAAPALGTLMRQSVFYWMVEIRVNTRGLNIDCAEVPETLLGRKKPASKQTRGVGRGRARSGPPMGDRSRGHQKTTSTTQNRERVPVCAAVASCLACARSCPHAPQTITTAQAGGRAQFCVVEIVPGGPPSSPPRQWTAARPSSPQNGGLVQRVFNGHKFCASTENSPHI